MENDVPIKVRARFQSQIDSESKIGIITIAFGLGLGFGIMMEVDYSGGYWVPLFLFTGTGIGFVVANIISRKLEKKQVLTFEVKVQ